MTNLFDLTGKNAIVTGASSGLGVQFAKALARQGANVALVARRLEKLEQTKAEVEKFGVKAIAIKCDVLNNDEIRRAVEEVKTTFGRIDILVNNAGTATSAPTVEHSDEEWYRVINTNLNSVFIFAREVGKVMVEQKYGKIINIGSIHSKVAMPGSPLVAYATSKGGVLMMTKALAAEWASQGITVNAIGPSYFESEMTDAVLGVPEVRAIIEKLAPAGRVGKPGELDGALIYFASDASSFTTGQLLNVDGGWTTV
ncbi:MAG: SDR family oxidoreductase [Bifidobacteriaceae bacterium]|jgi:gluconate 5-dehydrogenase|nr:SDR family oxidoreductase [Bifidobacteriaceae bacterium]